MKPSAFLVGLNDHVLTGLLVALDFLLGIQQQVDWDAVV
jgi:hypothetical protein